jgi:hypothetical protein
VYVFGGYTQGFLDATVNVHDPVFDFINFDVPLQFEYTGTLFGAGGTIAAGYKQVFGMIDANYSTAKLSTFGSELDMFMLSGRIGYLHQAANSIIIVWSGAMYQDMDQTLEQEFQLGEPAELHRIKVDVGAKHPVNMLLGARFEYKKRYGVTLEGGFIGRKQIILNLEYRF